MPLVPWELPWQGKNDKNTCNQREGGVSPRGTLGSPVGSSHHTVPRDFLVPQFTSLPKVDCPSWWHHVKCYNLLAEKKCNMTKRQAFFFSLRKGLLNNSFHSVVLNRSEIYKELHNTAFGRHLQIY